jgi:serine phosphatase RsbU (regulator of sigma subunit)
MINDIDFENITVDLPAHARLLLYSDGAVEISLLDGNVAEYKQFREFVADPAVWGNILERVLERARSFRGDQALIDDCSLMQLNFVTAANKQH